MAPRSRDVERTKLAYKAGVFRDKKKRSHYTLDGREFLFGEDKRRRHDEIIERAAGFCEGKCGAARGVANYIGANGEWDHYPISKGQGGDDSMANGRWLCRKEHRAKHPQVQLQRVPPPELWTHPEGAEP